MIETGTRPHGTYCDTHWSNHSLGAHVNNKQQDLGGETEPIIFDSQFDPEPAKPQLAITHSIKLKGQIIAEITIEDWGGDECTIKTPRGRFPATTFGFHSFIDAQQSIAQAIKDHNYGNK